MENRKFYASQCGVELNSDVYNGGGGDDTEPLQALLDKALSLGRVYLVLDGAARISKPLRIHANTTIECPDKSCGLFLSDNSDSCIIRNANQTDKPDGIKDRNITLLGGVYNHNSPGQIHHREEGPGLHILSNFVMAMEFCGVEHFLMRDVTIANQRVYAALILNFKHVTMENIHIDRRVRDDHQNQDGLHFFGPGRFLALRNIRGNSGDDFIALAPDELDLKSEIEDVLIDGVHFDDADQGIRLLCREQGRLDRVVIKNVTGTYRSYGFIMTPWFDSKTGGNYGNIIFDTVDVRPMKNNYDYAPPFLFKICGRIEHLTLNNIYCHRPGYGHTFMIAGGDYDLVGLERPERPTEINRLDIKNLYIDEDNQDGVQDAYIRIKSRVGSISISDTDFRRSANLSGGTFIRVEDGATVGDLRLLNVVLPSSLDKLMDSKPRAIHHFKADNVES